MDMLHGRTPFNLLDALSVNFGAGKCWFGVVFCAYDVCCCFFLSLSSSFGMLGRAVYQTQKLVSSCLLHYFHVAVSSFDNDTPSCLQVKWRRDIGQYKRGFHGDMDGMGFGLTHTVYVLGRQKRMG